MKKNKVVQHEKGSMVVNAIFAVATLGAVAVGGNFLYGDYRMTQEAKSTATTFDLATKAAVAYSQKNQSALLANQPVTGFPAPFTPTMEQLIAAGYAPAGFNPSANKNLTLVVQIAKEPASCTGDQCTLGLRVYPAGGITRNGQPDSRMAARIVDAMPSGLGWKSTPGSPAILMKAGKSLPNPLGANPASVVAATWIGTNRVATTVPPVSYDYRSVGCPPGYFGTQEQQRTITTDKWGNVAYGSWTTYSDTCEPPPPPEPEPEPEPEPPVVPPTPPVTPPPPESGGGGGGVIIDPPTPEPPEAPVLPPPPPPAPTCNTYTITNMACNGWFQTTKEKCTQNGKTISDVVIAKEKVGACRCSAGGQVQQCESF